MNRKQAEIAIVLLISFTHPSFLSVSRWRTDGLSSSSSCCFCSGKKRPVRPVQVFFLVLTSTVTSNKIQTGNKGLVLESNLSHNTTFVLLLFAWSRAFVSTMHTQIVWWLAGWWGIVFLICMGITVNVHMISRKSCFFLDVHPGGLRSKAGQIFPKTSNCSEMNFQTLTFPQFAL